MKQPSRMWVVALAVVGVVLGVCQPAQAAVPSDGGSQTYLQDTASGGMTATFTADDTNTGLYASTKKVPVVIIGDGCAATGNSDLSGKALTPSCVDLGGSGDSSLETAAAGIAVATYNNGGIAGVCRDCTFMTIKTDTNSSTGIKNALIEAVSRIKSAYGGTPTAASKAQGVILILYDHNLGYDSANPADEDLRLLLNNIFTQTTGPYVDASTTAITVVAPAGNGEPLDPVNPVPNGGRYQTDVPSYPCAYTAAPAVVDADDPDARLKLVFCVGSVDTATATKNKRSVFSNSGGWIDVSAPGQGVYATGGGTIDDTGAAAAIVAGAAARLHAITYATVYNMPWDIQQFLIRSLLAQTGVFAEDPTTDPLSINDLRATQAAVQAITAGTPLASSRTVTPKSLFARLWDALLGTPDAWAIHTPGHGGGVVQTIAKLSEPVDSFLVIPFNVIKKRDQFDVKGQAIGQPGTKFTLELLRHDCGTAESLGPCDHRLPTSYYNPTGTVVATLVPERAATFSSASSVLCRVRPDHIEGPTGATTLPIGTNAWAEGEYSIRLTVWRPGTTALSQRRIFVDKSADPSFREYEGTGAPMVLNDVVNAGSNVGNIMDNGSGLYGPYLEVVVGSSHGTVGKRVYVIDHKGVQLFKSDQLAGPIMSTPAVGDVIPGNGTLADGTPKLEIVVTADYAGGNNLYVFAPPNTSPALAMALPLGLKSSPSVGKASPSDDRDSIFVTTKGNLLHWYKYDGSTLALQDTAPLTCMPNGPADSESDPSNRNAYGSAGMNHGFPAAPSYCGNAQVMESKPLVANLRGMTNGAPPIRVFVASQDPLSTYGYDPQYGISPKLKLLPGFPLRWSSGFHPGGNFDVSAAYADNDGELELFNVEYDANVPGGASRVIKLEVQGATTSNATDARVDKRGGGADAVSAWIPGELFMYSGAAEGDLVTGDGGRYEVVVVGQTGTVYLYNSEATFLASAKMGGRGAGTPLIADIDNDGQVEILTTSDDRFLYAWSYDGTTALKLKRSLDNGRYGFPRALKSKPCFQPFPVATPLASWPSSSVLRCTAPMVADLDGDRHVELIAVAGTGALETNALYVWDFAASEDLATVPSDSGWLTKAFAWLFGEETLSAAGVTPPIINKAGECETPGCMAKTNSATISGIVRTPSATPIGGAPVILGWLSPATGGIVSLSAVADGSGYYLFDQVNPGEDYLVTANVASYAHQTQTVTPTKTYPDVVAHLTLSVSTWQNDLVIHDPDVDDSGGPVDLFGDIFGVAFRFGANATDSCLPDPDGYVFHCYDPRADLDGNGNIDLFNDIFGVALAFGTERWPTSDPATTNSATYPLIWSVGTPLTFYLSAPAEAAHGGLPTLMGVAMDRGPLEWPDVTPDTVVVAGQQLQRGYVKWTPQESGDYKLRFFATYPDGRIIEKPLYVRVGSAGGAGAASLDMNTLASVADLSPALPVLTPIGNQTVVVSGKLLFTVSASDPQPDDALTLTAQLEDGQALSAIGATFTDKGNKTGDFSWTPMATHLGKQYRVVFTATDPKGLRDTETITITVINPPLAITSLSDSPDPFIPASGQTTTIAATFNEAVTGWTLVLKHPTDTTISRTFTGTGSSLSQVWDGKYLKAGVWTLVPPGVTYNYTLSATAPYSGGNASQSGTITVLPPLAMSGLSDSPDPFTPASGQTTTITASLNRSASWTLVLKHPTDTTISRTFTGTGSSLSQVWDGKYLKAGVWTLVPPGVTYTYTLSAKDAYGGSASQSGTITVSSPVTVSGKTTVQ